MYCSKCGKELTGKEKFCPGCGSPIPGAGVNSIHKKKHHKTRKIFIGVVCILIMAGVGTAIYQFVYKDIFGEQYLAVVVNQDEKWGYINEKGKEVIPCEYDYAHYVWTNGVTIIGEKTEETEEGYKFGLIDAKGKMVIEPKYDRFGMGNGIIAMAEQDGLNDEGESVFEWGLFNSKGEMITDFKYQDVESLFLNKNGLTVVSNTVNLNGNTINKYGVVNEKGEEIIPLEYTYIWVDENFGNKGLIPVEKQIGNSYLYGFVNCQNEREIPYRYEDVKNFSANGLAAVSQGEKWGYINTDGDIVIPCKYDSAYSFSDKGLAFVIENGECKCIGEKGETVIPAGAYREYGRWVDAYWLTGDDLAQIQMESNDGNVSWGIINREGDVIIAPDVASSVYCYNASEPFTLRWDSSEDNQEQGYYKFATQEGELLNNTYDYARYFAENGWCCVGVKIGTDVDGNNQYRYNYIDEKEKTVLELPEKYILAGDFISVDQK